MADDHDDTDSSLRHCLVCGRPLPVKSVRCGECGAEVFDGPPPADPGEWSNPTGETPPLPRDPPDRD